MRRFVLDRYHHIHRNVLFVCGACGAGKTTTIRRLMEHDFHLGRRLRFAYINCADLSKKEFLLRIAAALCVPLPQPPVRTCDELQRAICAAADGSSTAALNILVFDEAEFTRSGTLSAMQQFVQLALRSNSVALLLVSNSKELSFLPKNRTVELLFEAYSTATLHQIAANAAALPLSASAAEFAAKRSTNLCTTDVRQLIAVCDAAGRIGRARVMLADAAAAADDDKENVGRKRPRPGDASGERATAKQRLESTVADVAAAVKNVGSYDAVSNLPMQTTMILACVIRCLKRKTSRARTTSQGEVRDAYNHTCMTMRVPMPSQSTLVEELQILSDRGVISSLKGKNGEFSVCGSVESIEATLKQSQYAPVHHALSERDSLKAIER